MQKTITYKVADWPVGHGQKNIDIEVPDSMVQLIADIHTKEAEKRGIKLGTLTISLGVEGTVLIAEPTPDPKPADAK